MRSGKKVQNMVVAGLLAAIGMVIPMVSPLKFVVEPVSYTLASHVPIFVAMFLSPPTAVFVAVGTAAGFFLGGFPLTIVLRASSHLVFATVGALILRKKPAVLAKPLPLVIFSLGIAFLHAICEVLIILPIYATGGNDGWMFTLFVLVGVGTVVHSLVDFALALLVWRALSRRQGQAI